MNGRFSRRDVLKGSSALALTTFATPIRAAAPPAEAVTPALIEAAQQGRQGRPLHLGRPAAGREGRQGVRSEVSRHFRPHRAHRRRARVQPHRPGAVEPHLRLRRGAVVGRRAFRGLEARRTPCALRSRGRGEALSARAQGPGRPVRQLPRVPLRDGAQHRSGEGGGRAEKLQAICSIRNGPARSSRRIRATAAPSSPRPTRPPVTWAGTISSKLAKQRVMQVQSASDPPKKLALGERAIMADGIEYGVFQPRKPASRST